MRSLAFLEKDVDDLFALVAQVSGNAAPYFTVAYTFVFRPGGVQYRNVFTTWPALMAARNQLDPSTPVLILIDDRLAGAHMTTVGASAPWNLDQTTLFSTWGTTQASLIIDVGAQFTSTSLRVSGALFLQSNATAPVWVPTTDAQLIIDNESTVQSNVAHQIVEVNVGIG